MGLRDRMYELTTVEEVDEFLKEFPTGAIFKAGTCHKTMQGFGYVEQALNPRDNIHVGFVRVVQSRPASNHIAEITKVVHQSPQLILFINGKPVYDVDNWNITPEALEIALNKHLGPAAASSCCSHSHCCEAQPLDSYIHLLEKFIEEELTEKEFTSQWLLHFQNDASPRSTQQFNALNSLFGDVDAALGNQAFPSAEKHQTSLKEKASLLLSKLKK